MLFAEGNVQWPATPQTIIGLVGVLAIISLIFGVAIQARKLFGRTPPMSEEFERRDKAIRKMIFASEHNMKERLDQQRERITKLEERYEEMQLDRERKWAQLQTEMAELANTLAFIRGKFEREET